MNSRRLSVFGLLVAFFFLAHAAVSPSTASAATVCETDDQCPERTRCIDNQCTLSTGPIATPRDPGADDECAADRRCRIRRLARKNRARRKMKAIREEQAVESLLARVQKRRVERIHRQAKPWTIGLHTSPLYAGGFLVGYSFTPRIKAEASLHVPSQSIYTTVDEIDVEGSHDHTVLSAGPTYFFGDSTVAPYARTTFLYSTGEFRPWGYQNNESLSTTTHALTFGGGVDIQFELGFHLRLGLTYRMLLFNQARRDHGDYNQAVEKALEDEFYPIDGTFLLGWAF